MIQVIKFFINLIISLIIITLVINVPGILIKYNKTKKIENTMIKYAQKNGGFVSNEETTAEEVLEYSLSINGLKDDVKNIKLTPNYNMKAQRHDEIKISMTLDTYVEVPFSNQVIPISMLVETKGYSHKYFKGIENGS